MDHSYKILEVPMTGPGVVYWQAKCSCGWMSAPNMVKDQAAGRALNHLVQVTHLTEEQIERRVEKMTDHLDALYMAGRIDSKSYHSQMADLGRWSDEQLDKLNQARGY